MKRRAESVFGLHFDFHATPDLCHDPIGQSLCEEDIREICRAVRPDFIQIDCKGHPGWASFPTACGNAMPAFRGDPLALWRRVTREEDVALYLHYSGVIDEKYCREHPDQAVMRADGTRSTRVTRTLGGYADDLLIPQLTELIRRYGIDGVWIDGDCWGSEVDYDPRTIAAFEAATGISLQGRLPVCESDPHYGEYREFCREAYRRYVRKYVDALHRVRPVFQVASNWAYSDHMPEPVTADVDFLSGDLTPLNALNSARYAGRAIAQQEMPWDLMSWNARCELVEDFRCSPPKHPIQIMQEAAAVIALGGGYQNYITQHLDGSPKMEEIRRMDAVSRFVRARAPYCFRGRAIPQVAVILSTRDRLLESKGLYSRNGMEKIMGLTALLCDAGHSTQIISEHTFHKKGLAAWPVVVVPETCEGLDGADTAALLKYARRGGSLVLIGPNTCAQFERAGAPIRLSARTGATGYFTMDSVEFGETQAYRSIAAEGEIIAQIGETYRSKREALAARIRFGEGTITAVGTDVGSGYHFKAQYMHRKLINAALCGLYHPLARLISVEGLLELVCLEKEGRLMLQLINANGNHHDAGTQTEDFLPPCLNIWLAIAAPAKPTALILQPEGRSLPFTYEGGEARVSIDRVDIHEVIEVCP